MIPDSSISRPLTAVPSPHTLALKHQQAAAKVLPASRESALLRKYRQQESKRDREKAAPGVDVKVNKDGVENGRDLSAAAAAAATSTDVSVVSHAASEVLTTTSQALMRNKPRSVAMFCAADVSDVWTHKCGTSAGVRSAETTSGNFPPKGLEHKEAKATGTVRLHSPSRSSPASAACFPEGTSDSQLFLQEADGEDYWERLAQASTPPGESEERLNPATITPQIQAKILAFKAQVMVLEYKECTKYDNLALVFL